MSSPKITLYTYFRSSCSARLRIALHLKSLPHTSLYINLLKGEQLSTSNRERNPSATVPTLIISSDTSTITITQSLAALEYLDEAFPDTTPLLPATSNPAARATVRTLADIISCDVQPVTNLRILQRVAPFGVDRAAWSKDLIEDGLRAYEAIAVESAGAFSVGDEITIADVCLLPAVWGAQRSGVDMSAYPTVSRVVERLEKEEAVKKAHWATQEDTPEELKLTL